MKKQFYSIALSVLFLISCRIPATDVGCNRIVDPRLRSAPMVTLMSDTMQEWAATTYQLAQDHFAIDRSSATDENGAPRQVFMRWEHDNGHYTALASSHTTYIWVDLIDRPRIKEVLACFGAPAAYLATSKLYVGGFEVSLWYPREGLVFEHGVSMRGFGLPPDLSVNDETRISRVKRVKPSSIEDMIANVYGQGTDVDFRTKVIAALKPWPGDVNKMTIDK